MSSTPSVRVARRLRADAGMALITVVLVTMLCAALMVGFTSAIVSDLRSSGLDRDQTQAYAAAHAGLEKLTADITQLFRTDFSPSAAQISALTADSRKPVISNPDTHTSFAYLSPDGSSGYSITFTPDDTPGNVGNPKPEPSNETIASGPFEGLKGLITEYTLTVTARPTGGGSEVRLRRSLQTVAIPVFQFGMFSETDLAFHAGDDFNFGGRVHTNGNLYLAQADSSTLTLSDRITAVGEVIRTHLPNDLATSSGYNGTVLVPTVIRSSGNTTRAIARTEGSLTGASGLPSNGPTTAFWTTRNTGWDTISTGTYKSNIRNGRTGAKRLDLPIVGDLNGDGAPDAEPIELIRRPRIGEPAFIRQQRYYSMASLRILLSDDDTDINNLPGVTGTGPANGPVSLDPTNPAYLVGNYLTGMTTPMPALNTWAPLAASAAYNVASPTVATVPNVFPAGTYRSNAGQPLLGGWIKIEMQRQDGTWLDVTKEILSLGIAGRNLADVNTYSTASPATAASSLAAFQTRLNKTPDSGDPTCQDPSPNAIIRLQRVRDVPQGATITTSQANANANAAIAASCGYAVDGSNRPTTISQVPTDYWPMALYDSREAQIRDGLSGNDLYLAGVMHYVELDMNNLRRWLLGQIGTNGTQAKNDNGFIVYFSDRRNNNDYAGNETGEYGYEDTVNPATAAGTPNGTAPAGGPDGTAGLDVGEDVNGNGTLQEYGKRPRFSSVPLGPDSCGANGSRGQAPLNCNSTVRTLLDNASVGGPSADQDRLKKLVARANKALVFRRALKIVNGGIQTAATPNSCTATMAAPCNNIIAPGLTIASENPVYIQGNYNATSASANVEPNVASAVLADSVTMLSNAWNDLNSFLSPTASDPTRNSSTTGYRVAIVTGKTRFFPKPGTVTGTSTQSFGSDGGAHNFLRLLENWNNAANPVLRYRGSFVSFFYSRQATGSFKCCAGDAYVRGERDWSFDLDFTNPALLPPGTPMFRDVNTLTFRQMLRPTEQ